MMQQKTENLTKRLILSVILILLLILPSAAYNTTDVEFNQVKSNFSYSKDTVYVFSSTYCSACHKVLPVIRETASNHTDVSVLYYDVDLSEENLTVLFDFAEHYRITYPGLPAVYTGDTVVIEGSGPIASEIEDIFQGIEDGLIPSAEYEKRWYPEQAVYTPRGPDPEDMGPNLNLYLVLTAGLLDGINPCAFAVLVFLLISLMTAESKIRVLSIGFVYIAAVFLFYVLAGLGIMSIVSYTETSSIFSLIAGIVAVFAGLLSMNEGFSEKSRLSLGIPESSKEYLNSIIKRASLPAAFVLGIIVGLFELPCTGGIYLAVLSLLSSETTFYEGIPYLILYNLMFVLPLAVIVGLVYSGLAPAAVNEFRKKHRKELKVIIGTILVFIGFFVIFNTI